MTPVTLQHALITAYLRSLMETYFALRPIGIVVGEPFVLRLDTIDASREPDLQIILKTNPGQLTETAMIGPADICIEVVSPESVARDHGDKYQEYEKGGVREYWIIDPIRQETRFNRLTEKGIYATIAPDADGYYETPLLPGLRVYVPTLWVTPLPDIISVVNGVREMLSDGS